MTRVLIVGGSDAGIAAALRAREVDPGADVTVVVADRYPNYSICGLPYLLSGEVEDHRDLAHRTAGEIEGAGVRLLLGTTALACDPASKTVKVAGPEGRVRELPYDRLVVGTGAAPARPKIAGLDLDGVYFLHSMDDSFRLRRQLIDRDPRSAVIVGAGYIGLEMADALTLRGLRVTVVGRAATVLPTVDADLGRALEDELRRSGVEVVTKTEVEAVESDGPRLSLSGAGGFRRGADLVLVATGVRPVIALAEGCGAGTGVRRAIRVNRRMETEVPGVYAAGDCAETYHRLLGRNGYLPLGTTAHKQGRIAGENAVTAGATAGATASPTPGDAAGNAAGGGREFAGSLGTQVVKIFGLVAARTGLLEDEARDAGFEPVTVDTEADDHKRYYPGARGLSLRVTGDRVSGRLLGAQILGPWGSEVAKRVDVFAAALHHGMRIEELSDLDLSYTPPVGAPWDAVQAAAQRWEKAARPLIPA